MAILLLLASGRNCSWQMLAASVLMVTSSSNAVLELEPVLPSFSADFFCRFLCIHVCGMLLFAWKP